MQFLGAIATAVLFIAVQCQLLDKTEIEVGGSFNLTCDVGRIGSVPAAVTGLYGLSIERTVLTSRKPTTVAVYSPNHSKNLTKFIPNGRQWVIEASGGRGSATDPDSNRASIKLALYVRDAQCADAGLYFCNANFPTVLGVSTAERSQKITYKGTCNTATRLGVMDSQGIVRNMFLVGVAKHLLSRFI
ncbi:unnamed protein product [Lymnaea stagnalis]|uniref:Ig-like domain-containing protein n=1 Tax=Lymnaea stagnalis TaxID=6523 RepID=A0AAV2I4V5_LYMST